MCKWEISVRSITLKLAIGHQWSTECDASDVSAQVSHSLEHTCSWVSIQVRVLNHILGNACENSRQAHKAVESCHKLGQVWDFNTLGNGQTCSWDMKKVKKKKKKFKKAAKKS